MEKSQETINALVKEKLEDISTDVKEIKAQTIKTNGRVGSLENWQYMIIGGLGVVTVVLVPLFISVFIK